MTEIEKVIIEDLKEIKEALKDLPCSARGERFARLESRVDHMGGWLKGVMAMVSGIIVYVVSRIIQTIIGSGQ